MRPNLIPPYSGDEGSDGLGHQIPPVGGGVIHEARSDDFRDESPDDKMESDFLGVRNPVVGAPVEPTLYQQQVVEMIVQEPNFQSRFQSPAVQRIQSDRDQTKRVVPIPE